MVFQLRSINVGTDFDSPTRFHTPPITLDNRVEEALALIDGAVRAPHRLSRLVKPSALLGIALQRPEETLTVAIDLRDDILANTMWHDHSVGTRAALRKKYRNAEEKDLEAEVPDLSARHRCLLVSAQGRTVGAVVLGLRPVDGEAVRQRVQFQVSPAEFGGGHFLMLGIDSADFGGHWNAEGAMADGAVGLGVGRVEIIVGAEPIGPSVACARGDDKGAHVLGVNGFFVVNPGTPANAYTLDIAVRGMGGDRLRGRRARVKHPARAVREYAEERRLTGSGVTVEATDLDGQPVPGLTIDGTTVEVPAGTGPILVRPTKRDSSGDQVLVDWSVKVR